jgi:hypothetical protein
MAALMFKIGLYIFGTSIKTNAVYRGIALTLLLEAFSDVTWLMDYLPQHIYTVRE